MANKQQPTNVERCVVFGMVGIICAQFALHSIILTLWAGPLRSRLLVGTIIGLGFFLAWAAGQKIHALQKNWTDSYLEIIGLAATSVPLFLVMVELPLWLLRLGCGWRIYADGSSFSKLQAGPWRIQHLMWGMAVVAFSFALVRFASPANTNQEFLFGVFVGAGVAGLASLVSLPLTVFALFRCRRIGLALLWVLLGNIAVIGLLWAIVAYFDGQPPLDFYLDLGGLMCGYLWSLVMPLVILRRFGFRLCWGKELIPN